MDAVNEGVFALLLNQHLGAVAFVGPDVVFLDGFQDGGETFLDFTRVVTGTVAGEQEFQNKRGHIGALLHLEEEIFADDFAREDLVEFRVERV